MVRIDNDFTPYINDSLNIYFLLNFKNHFIHKDDWDHNLENNMLILSQSSILERLFSLFNQLVDNHYVVTRISMLLVIFSNYCRNDAVMKRGDD